VRCMEHASNRQGRCCATLMTTTPAKMALRPWSMLVTWSLPCTRTRQENSGCGEHLRILHRTKAYVLETDEHAH